MMTPTEKARFEALTFDKVTKTYGGRAHRCCCGCSGTFGETDRSKKLALNKLKRNMDSVEDFGNGFSLEAGDRLTAVYTD